MNPYSPEGHPSAGLCREYKQADAWKIGVQPFSSHRLSLPPPPLDCLRTDLVKDSLGKGFVGLESGICLVWYFPDLWSTVCFLGESGHCRTSFVSRLAGGSSQASSLLASFRSGVDQST